MTLTESSRRDGFTFIEMILVIVVLGIVSSLGAQMIANAYRNYVLQRATHRASLKTELAAQQIANLLSYRIPRTTIARNEYDLNDSIMVTDPTLASDNTHILLEWIGSESDGFRATIPPAWSGFCDLNASGQSVLSTPGSNLSLEGTILSNLSNGQINFTSSGSGGKPAIFFRNARYAYSSATGSETLYDPLTCLGMTNNTRNCISSVRYANNNTFSFHHGGPGANYVPNKVITEHYKLAASAYSILQVPRADGLYDLKLCYNYRPWENQRLTLSGGFASCPGSLSTIITAVSVFKFAESGSTFRFKLCSQENIGEDYNVTICKEKAVIQ